MIERTLPVVKDLVLIGGGHSHVEVLRRFGMRPVPGVRVTLITREVQTLYSGMLPGFVAGHYDFDDVHIDLVHLCRFAGARLYHQSVDGLDLDRRLVICEGRPAVPYDLVSINIGSTPSIHAVPGAMDVVVPVKPISNFVKRWECFRERVASARGPLRVGVVGVGAGGVELTLAMQFSLCRMLEELGRSNELPEFHLFGASKTILQTHNRGARRRFEQMLRQRGVKTHLGQAVTAISAGQVTCADGTVVRLDEILGVTQAGAASWVREAGLDVDDYGFVHVLDTLQSTSHPDVFAAGDIAAVVNHPREKAGVFAVRQGPPLADNLRRALLGRSVRPFRPQRRFLTLVSTGGRHAIGSRGLWSFEGALVWRWKDWIDRRFIAKYRKLPTMTTGSTPVIEPGLASPEVLREISTVAMRCGGCGSKVGAKLLDRVIGQLRPVYRDDVLVGLDAPDDAAVLSVPADKVLVRTVDSFREIVNDPFVFGQIAANHCLGDIFAMGAEAQTALAIATVPFGLEEKIEDTLVQLLTGAVGVLNEAGASLVGGHTSEGAELAIGFSLTGLADPTTILRKSGLRPGDRLVLTKGIGTGTLFAAEMRMRAKGRWIEGAIAAMCQSSRTAVAVLQRFGATACTDVTGFGLLGHLVEMTKASGVQVLLNLSSVPVLDGALETSGAGLLSSLHSANVRLRRALADVERAALDRRYPLLYDPQTAGGLLAGLPGDYAERCVEALHADGYDRAAIIGVVEQQGADDFPVRLV